MNTITKASSQWSNRPADERFWTIDDLQNHVDSQMINSVEQNVDVAAISATTDDTGALRLCFDGDCPELTNWSFGQLCAAGETTAGMLVKMPGDLASDVVNRYTLPRIAEKRDKIVILKTGNEIRSATSSTYGRLWNADLIRAIRPAYDLGWMTPPARPAFYDTRTRPATEADIVPGQENFGLSIKVGDPIAPAGNYGGDRDIFVLMVNPERVIDAGDGSPKMQGMIVQNSELGNGSLFLGHYLLDTVCGNHILWGVSSVRELKKRHTTGNLQDIQREIRHWIRDVSESTMLYGAETLIQSARKYNLGKDQESTISRLYDSRKLQLTKDALTNAWRLAVEYEHVHGDPTSLWGMISGLTRYSQSLPYADARYEIDTGAKKMLELVA